MTDTTLDQARRCPRCEQPGAANGARSAGRTQGTIHIFKCLNARCKWYNTDWTVQVRPDGSIPEATLKHDKSFPKIPDHTDRYQEYYNRLQESTMIAGGGQA